jgi:hypothetical protein
VQGAWGQRAQAQGASRVQQRQEQSGAEEIGDVSGQAQLLHGLGQARRIIDSGAPTGPLAPEALAIGRQAHISAPWAQGYVGIPNDYDVERLGTLEKVSGLMANVMQGQGSGQSDQASRESLRNSLFGIDKDAPTNRQNVNYITQQVIGDLLAARVRQAWRSRYGDVNAVDPATGMNATDYTVQLRSQLPTDASEFEHPERYRTRVVLPNGANFDLPELQTSIRGIASLLRGDGDFSSPHGNSRASPPHGAQQGQAAPTARSVQQMSDAELRRIANGGR